MKQADPEMNKQHEISDDVVRKRTGKSWRQWYSAIDSKIGRSRSHQEIVAIIRKIDPGVSGWWQQTITVAYEQARGLRKKHEMSDGFRISVSRTFPLPISTLFKNFRLKRSRDRWYPDMPIEFTTINPDKNLRMKWTLDNSRLEVQFNSKDKNKTQIVVQHACIKTESRAKRMKTFWKEQLDILETFS